MLLSIIDFFSVTNEKGWGVANDPNDWAIEHNDLHYILNLVRRVVRVGLEMVRIVKALPALEEF